MTIEKSLERIAEALETLILCQSVPVAKVEPVPAPVAKVEPVPAPVPVPVAMPEPIVPDFMGVVEVTTCPITDQKSLLAYVMDAYTTMGPEKGAKIQDVLTSIGAAHLNDVKADHYGTIFTQVEELKK